MKIQRISTELDPATLAPGWVTITLELGRGQTAEQAVEAVQALCSTDPDVPAPVPPKPEPVPPAPKPAPKPKPGMDPAAAMAAYDALLPAVQRKRPSRPSIPVIWAGRDGYPDSAVTKVGVAKDQPGSTVLVLEDGTKILAKVGEAGHLVEVQRKPSAQAESRRMARDELFAANEVDVVPGSTMRGKLAPPPGGDPPSVPHPAVNDDGLVVGVSEAIRAAVTISAAVEVAVAEGLAAEDGAGRDGFEAWAQRVKAHVPAFARVSRRRFVSRVMGIYDRTVGGQG